MSDQIQHPWLSRQNIQDLWRAGLTVVERPSAERLLDMAGSLAPAGMSYQWNDHLNAAAKVVGWKCVPASRHPGVFMPYGYTGDIEIGGLWLMERPKAEVDAFHAGAHAKARANVDNWFQRQASAGFTGGVTVLSEGRDRPNLTDMREVGDKTLESVTQIPREIQPYIGEVFAERDRLWTEAAKWWGNEVSPEYQKYAELAGNHPDWTRGQLMNAVLTPIAIDNIRKRLATEGARHAEKSQGSTNIPSDGAIGSGGCASDPPRAGTTESGRQA